MTYDEIEGRLDLDHIEAAARVACTQLRVTGKAFVELTPGDMTSYRFVVVNTGHDYQLAGGHYIVAMINNSQVCYPWDGQHTRAEYVHQKWFPKDNEWSPTVLAYFLNTLATALP